MLVLNGRADEGEELPLRETLVAVGGADGALTVRALGDVSDFGDGTQVEGVCWKPLSLPPAGEGAKEGAGAGVDALAAGTKNAGGRGEGNEEVKGRSMSVEVPGALNFGGEDGGVVGDGDVVEEFVLWPEGG